ncbi:hypothetical protein [Longispora fulva]|uniref:Endonuclease III n=1 Tax=Longispora fulva TaxID=619741 RepID=A0A8J7GHF1_9ACTN|nr:hypothetical protein [Longispora fulva]MBG6136328.1 hypothetical protein [Longispora fulva]
MDGALAPVVITSDGGKLRVQAPTRAVASAVEDDFGHRVGDLALGTHPVLAELGRQFADVAVLTARPIALLILTILEAAGIGPDAAGRRLEEIDWATGGLDLSRVVQLPAIRLSLAEPPLSGRLRLALHGLAEGIGELGKLLKEDPAEALAELAVLPGVGPATAVRVLAGSTRERRWVPPAGGLLRISGRLGLGPAVTTRNDALAGRTTATISRLAPDAGLLSEILIWLSRTVCYAKFPQCGRCPLARVCPSSGQAREVAA